MKSILIGLLLTLWIACFSAYTQTDSVYCLPISKARLLIADALRLQVVEDLHVTLTERVHLLEERELASYASFSNLLKLSELKYEKQKENTSHMERLALSYKGERDYYIKRERKQRWKKNVLCGALVAVIVLSLIK